MQYIKSQMLEFDEVAERERIKRVVPHDLAQPLLAILDALEAGDLKAASDRLNSDAAEMLPSDCIAILRAYRDHEREPEWYGHPMLKVPKTFENPNDVRAQHRYALHALHAHRYALAQLIVALNKKDRDEEELAMLAGVALKVFRAANGAAENDSFRLVEDDGQLELTFD